MQTPLSPAMTPGLPLTVQVLAGGGVDGALLVGNSAPRATAAARAVKAVKAKAIRIRFVGIITR